MMLAAQRQRAFFPPLLTVCCHCCPGDGRAVALIVKHWEGVDTSATQF